MKHFEIDLLPKEVSLEPLISFFMRFYVFQSVEELQNLFSRFFFGSAGKIVNHKRTEVEVASFKGGVFLESVFTSSRIPF